MVVSPQILASAEVLAELARLRALVEKLAKQDNAIEQAFLKKMQALSELGSFYASNPLLSQLAEVATPATLVLTCCYAL